MGRDRSGTEGRGRRPVFWAEVSSNHNQDLDRCFRMIDAAAEAGFDGVKFQLFRVRELFSPEVLARSEEHRRREAWELPRAFVPDLAARCDERGVDFVCTPFDLEAVEVLEPHVATYKIASYELLWDGLLEACARTGRPVVLSTGMATMDEVGRAVETMRRAGCAELTLLHCVSAYPAPAEECNLAAIETMRAAFGCEVGWSDHSVSPGVVHRAVHRHGASLVEVHFDVDGAGVEFGMGHCWLPATIGPVIAAVREGLAADGDGVKAPTEAERPDRRWRADPSDGLRPLLEVRRELGAGGDDE